MGLVSNSIAYYILCQFNRPKVDIPCQTPNYQILLIYDIYNLNISRFQLSDILVFIADIPTLQIQYFLSYCLLWKI